MDKIFISNYSHNHIKNACNKASQYIYIKSYKYKNSNSLLSK